MTRAQAQTLASLIVGNSPATLAHDYTLKVREENTEVTVSIKTEDSTFSCRIDHEGELFDKREVRTFRDW